MKLINTTPHDINYVHVDGTVQTFPKSDAPARCTETTVLEDSNFLGQGLRLVRKKFGMVENLPAPTPDTFYIVSAIVKAACPDRTDIVLVSDTVRNGEGQIVGCQSFAL
jgi:hypothetical protein